MTLLKELIEAAEQAARDEVIAAVNAPFFPGEVRVVPSTRGALERVIKAAVATVKDDAESAAIARFGPTVRTSVAEKENLLTANLNLLVDLEKTKQQLEEAKQIISDLQNGASHVYPELRQDCAHCQAFGRATKFLEAA